MAPFSEDCRWFGLETLEQSRSAIATAIAMEPIATTITSPELTPAPGLLTAAPYSLSISGLWAGPVTHEIKERLLHHYYIIMTSLLPILLSIITNSLVRIIASLLHSSLQHYHTYFYVLLQNHY